MNLPGYRQNFFRSTLACIITASLAACGGGSGSNSASTSAAGTNNASSSNADSGTSSPVSNDTSHANADAATPHTTTLACLENATTSTLKITTTSCPVGKQGTAYAGCTIEATGGKPPYSYCVSTAGQNPPLPSNMKINPSTGVVSSSYIAGQGAYGTKLVVIDAAKNVATKVINFSINGNNAFLANIFPANSIFRHRVDVATTNLPVDTSPAAPFNRAYLSQTIKHYFGNTYSAPWPYGTPAIEVPYNEPMVAVATTPYTHMFTEGPIPSYAPVEDTLYSTGDRHVIVYQAAGGGKPPALYEMYQGIFTNVNGTGSWSDSSNALWPDVNTNALTPQSKGTTNAAGLPNGPLLITADEVIGTGTPSAPNGAIKHMIRLTLPSMLNNWVWPAAATSGKGSCKTSNGVAIPTWTMLSQVATPYSCSETSPAGQIYRLKASAVTPACAATSPQASIIITALRHYGMINGDNGYAGQLLGTADARWNDKDLDCLSKITLAEFEPVNVSSLMISPTSGQTSH